MALAYQPAVGLVHHWVSGSRSPFSRGDGILSAESIDWKKSEKKGILDGQFSSMIEQPQLRSRARVGGSFSQKDLQGKWQFGMFCQGLLVGGSW